MKIIFDDKEYTLQAELEEKIIDLLWQSMESLYEEKIDDSAKIGLMTLTRAFCLKQEMSVLRKLGKEAARAFRPPKHDDPTLWMARKMRPALEEVMQNVRIICKASGAEITSLSAQQDSCSGGG